MPSSIRCNWDAPTWLQELPDRPPPWVDARPWSPWNLRGMLRAWEEHPRAMDFLDSGSSNHAWKALQTRLYLELLREQGLLPAPSPPLRIFDAACGIGRFAIPLALDGHHVDLLDACEPSLRCAERHLIAAAERDPSLPDRIRLRWGDVEALDELPSPPQRGSYDLVLAMELLCYLGDPIATARRLAALLRPGGHLVLSVEAWPGCLLSDAEGLRLADLGQVLTRRTLALPDDRWLRAVDATELASMIQAAGLRVLSLQGSHYLPDGPFAQLLEIERIGEAGYDDEVLALERSLREEPGTSPLPRAWLAVAEREG